MTAKLFEKRVKDVMSRDLVTADAADTMHDALQLMAENKVAVLPIVDRQGRCMGILSTTDLLEVARDLEAALDDLEHSDELLFAQLLSRASERMGHQSVMDLMSENVVSADPEATLPATAAKMLRERVHRLPVVDKKNHLVGIVSTMDILAAFVDGAPTD